MRINVYAEELTEDIELVSKVEGERVFYGVRFYLKSSESLHHTSTDDDRSAVTFWVPWTKIDEYGFQYLAELFAQAQNVLSVERK